MWEIAARRIPYIQYIGGKGVEKGLNVVDIVNRIVNEELRPDCECEEMKSCPREVLVLMREAWQDDPAKRPAIRDVHSRLQSIVEGGRD